MGKIKKKRLTKAPFGIQIGQISSLVIGVGALQNEYLLQYERSAHQTKNLATDMDLCSLVTTWRYLQTWQWWEIWFSLEKQGVEMYLALPPS